MITLVIGGVIFFTFLVLFYLEDRDGGGLYDPDPSASYRHKNQTNENRISDCYSCSWSSLWFDCTRNNQ